MSASRVERIRERLQCEFVPQQLNVDDDSHKHVGHVGARDGRGHFSVHIVSAAFHGMPLLARHRRVYAALGDMMQTDIHALAIDARTPDEMAKK